ncbi:hypothetical protein Clacol_001954 [Clathrus columnatus]|uniref:Uncharacterized protein n=1 Tax=Clathrus columnatus TaxID=1419009 RepID=A0AAV5A4R3_9AGAM|nr:hypothetical protein Clacol_001954 [Clathrus columnatus]
MPQAQQRNVASRTNNPKQKPLVYQSSLDLFLKPIPGGTKKNAFTTPVHKRKRQTIDGNELTEDFNKKQKRSLNQPAIEKNYERDPGMHASTPIVVTDNSDDEFWDGDTLCNTASTNRTLVAGLEKTPFNSKPKFTLEQSNDSDHTPPPTRATSRADSASNTPITSSRFRDKLSVIPSSQAHERASPLVIPLDIEETRLSDSLFQPPKQTTSEEVIPSSQSQYLLPYVISPARKRKFTVEPTAPLNDLIPCSQEPQQLDLVLLARELGFGADPTSITTGTSTASAPNSVDDCPSQDDGNCDESLSSTRHDLNCEQQPDGHVIDIHSDEASVDRGGSLLAVRNSDFLEQDAGSELDNKESAELGSLPSSSLPPYEGNDSQYTYVEETCPSQILDFLMELDQRVESQPEPNLMPTTPKTNPEKDEELEIPCCSSMSLVTSSSQFSIGPSSQYTFVEASVPSDIAEFLDELDNPSYNLEN